MNHDSLPSFPEHDCPGRCKPDCSVDINGGSNKPGLNRNSTVSAGKENSYLIYIKLYMEQLLAALFWYNCAFCVEMTVKRILYRNQSSIPQGPHILGGNFVAGGGGHKKGVCNCTQHSSSCLLFWLNSPTNNKKYCPDVICLFFCLFFLILAAWMCTTT